MDQQLIIQIGCLIGVILISLYVYSEVARCERTECWNQNFTGTAGAYEKLSNIENLPTVYEAIKYENGTVEESLYKGTYPR